MKKKGFFPWLGEIFFGSQAARPKCSQDYCRNRADPRCFAAHCTSHCKNILNCDGACVTNSHAKILREVITIQQENESQAERDEKTRSVLAAYLLK